MIPRLHKLRNFVYQLEVDLPVGYTEMVDLLKLETWPRDTIGYGQSNLAARYRLNDPVNPVLKHILDTISSSDFKKSIIAKLYSEVGGESDFPGSSKKSDFQRKQPLLPGLLFEDGFGTQLGSSSLLFS